MHGLGGCIRNTLFICILFIIPMSKAAWSHDTMLDFENDASSASGFSYLGTLDDCFSSGKIVYPQEIGELNNVYFPPTLGKGGTPEHSGNQVAKSITASIGRAAAYAMFGPSIGAIAMGIEYTIMVDTCTNAYIVAPHEHVNRQLDRMKCERESSKLVNNADDALTERDIPFFYSCNPDDTWGYMGAASTYCVGDAHEYARADLVGKIIVEHISGTDRFFHGYSDDSRCKATTMGKKQAELAAGDLKYLSGNVHYYAHYRWDQKLQKVQICVVSPYTLFPIRVGCGYVAPPKDGSALGPFLRGQLEDTRCLYFITGRTDLKSLGNSLESSLGNASPVTEFLKSDLHLTSTTIGCFKDLLIRIFINPKHPGKAFFYGVQQRLADIVLAFLVMYVAIVGITILSSSQVPSREQWIIYTLKFALVLYFGTAAMNNGSSTAWYSVNELGEAHGIYPMLLYISEYLSNLFFQAYNSLDFVGMCSLPYQGSNLLGDRLIQSGGAESTIGFHGVKLTPWDLLDCKIANYLNLGSCQYSPVGLLALWFTGAAFFVPGIGFILSILFLIYSIVLLIVAFKLAYIFILSMFVITLLVLLSPIMICFALFEATKGIFQSWFRMLLGYALYPGLLFVFVALMLATFDKIYYGNIDPVKADQKEYKAACYIGEKNEVKSLFCTTIQYLNIKNPCSKKNDTYLLNIFTEKQDLGKTLGVFLSLKSDSRDYFLPLLEMVLLSLLFYIFMNGVDSFISVLVGVQGFGEHVKTASNTILPVEKIADKSINISKKTAAETIKAGKNASKMARK